MSTSNISAIVAYDGHNYLGWQKTKEGPSIEGTLQATLEKILQEPIVLQAASRTDRGVHAEGQVVQWTTTKLSINSYKDDRKDALTRLHYSLNQLLPHDIRILSLQFVPSHFHPTKDAKKKCYCYRIYRGVVLLPRLYHTHWHIPGLDVEALREAIPHLIGSHDFKALCNYRKDLRYPSTVREISSLEIKQPYPDEIEILITADSFMYKMARNLAGLLAYVGQKKIVASSIPEILGSRHRPRAGITAPAHGLTLLKIWY